MNRSSRSIPLFTTEREYTTFLSVLAAALQRHTVSLLVFSAMPTHWHLVLRVSQLAELSRFMHWLSSTHAKRWHRARHSVGLGPVYKGRFLSVPIEAEAELVRVCRYVERNALQAGIVRRSEDWPWSSLYERLRSKRRVPLTSAPFLESAVWLEHVNAVLTSRELVAMHRLALDLDAKPMGTVASPVRGTPGSAAEPVPEKPVSVEN